MMIHVSVQLICIPQICIVVTAAYGLWQTESFYLSRPNSQWSDPKRQAYKNRRLLLNRDRKVLYLKINRKQFVLRLLYPLTACTRPVITLSMQRCGTSSRSFRQTLCHTMSVRLHADSRGAITPRTRPVHRKSKTMLSRHYRKKIKSQVCTLTLQKPK